MEQRAGVTVEASNGATNAVVHVDAVAIGVQGESVGHGAHGPGERLHPHSRLPGVQPAVPCRRLGADERRRHSTVPAHHSRHEQATLRSGDHVVEDAVVVRQRAATPLQRP